MFGSQYGEIFIVWRVSGKKLLRNWAKAFYLDEG